MFDVGEVDGIDRHEEEAADLQVGISNQNWMYFPTTVNSAMHSQHIQHQ